MVTRRDFLFGRKIVGDESGATAIEYGLTAGLISIAIVSGLISISTGTKKAFKCTKRAIKGKKQSKKCGGGKK